MEISLTEENYIKAIYSITRSNKGEGVTTNQLSERLQNKAGSVTDMLKRLAEKKLINYRKYQGVILSGKGMKIALDIVRKHRLWEVFLMEKLHFTWDEVHDIAEQLEHVRSEELVTRLDKYLGRPKYDPHGDPIPDASGELDEQQALPLNQFATRGDYVFTGVSDHSKYFLRYLTSIGLKIGDRIRVEEVNGFDQSMKVRINKNPGVFLSEKVSAHILVEQKK